MLNSNLIVLRDLSIKQLEDRGVTLDDMAILVLDLQKKYNPELTLEEAKETLLCVMSKREVTHAILTGIAIDISVEKGEFAPFVNEIILDDKPLYGIDEILALSIVNVYGSIALTNFGYLDKLKPGIIGVVDKLGKEENKCNTFLDDIIGALVAAAVSRIAHK